MHRICTSHLSTYQVYICSRERDDIFLTTRFTYVLLQQIVDVLLLYVDCIGERLGSNASLFTWHGRRGTVDTPCSRVDEYQVLYMLNINTRFFFFFFFSFSYGLDCFFLFVFFFVFYFLFSGAVLPHRSHSIFFFSCFRGWARSYNVKRPVLFFAHLVQIIASHFMIQVSQGRNIPDLYDVAHVAEREPYDPHVVQGTFRGVDLYYADPAQHVRTADQSLDDRDHDLCVRLEWLDDLDHNLSVRPVCVFFGSELILQSLKPSYWGPKMAKQKSTEPQRYVRLIANRLLQNIL